MTTHSTPTAATEQVKGRALVWTGLGLCLLGLALIAIQFSLKHLFVPWYSPALATIGAILLLVALMQRVTVVRLVALFVVTLFAGFQWFVLGSMLKLPAYEGPAQAGKPLPAFTATRADGSAFTEANLADGERRVLVFFRGRW